MKNSISEENYLKVIFALMQQETGGVSTNSIAMRLNTRASSVTDMLRKLSAKDLITYRKYQGAALTDKGMSAAIEIVRKHRLWELFLLEKLGFGWDQVHDIAEQMEHIDSPELTTRLYEFLEAPKFDPHGDPIPDQEGNFPDSGHQRLSDLGPGDHCIVMGVILDSGAFLQYLDKIGIAIGISIEVLEFNPFDHSVDIMIEGRVKEHISREVSENLLVNS